MAIEHESEQELLVRLMLTGGLVPCSEKLVTEAIREGIRLYTQHHIKTGSFMQAVIENDLELAVIKADNYNSMVLSAITNYVYNNVPSEARGSKQAFADWTDARRVTVTATGSGSTDDKP